MLKHARGGLYRLLLPLLILTLACSLSPSIPLTGGIGGYSFDSLPDKTKQNSAIANYQAISKWSSTTVTYYFTNGTDQLPGNTEQNVIKQAFAVWAAQVPLTFTQVDNQSDANIVIGWATGDHGDGDPFDGPGDVLAHSTFPNPYDNRQVFLHFDDAEHWVDSTSSDVDLETVAIHEIGHTLGLDHSDDPNAIMYPSYDGPRRALGADDIAGIQELYGIASAPAPAPDVPGSVTPPPASGQDTDQDGISDQDELLVTGTDVNNPDSDGDGLTDGVEVQNRMNPLNPDMDHDGVSDGQEVAQGTDPLFPEQSDIPQALEQQVSDFLTQAIQLEIDAYRNGSADRAASVMSGQALATLQSNIDTLNQQGLVSISEFDYYRSFIDDIRVVDNSTLEGDTCEFWTDTTYRASDGQPVDSQGPNLVPQTLTLQQQGSSWSITSVQFFDPPAFCNA